MARGKDPDELREKCIGECKRQREEEKSEGCEKVGVGCGWGGGKRKVMEKRNCQFEGRR